MVTLLFLARIMCWRQAPISQLSFTLLEWLGSWNTRNELNGLPIETFKTNKVTHKLIKLQVWNWRNFQRSSPSVNLRSYIHYCKFL